MAVLKYIAIFLMLSCTSQRYYAVVVESDDLSKTIQIEKGFVTILFYVQDSTLVVGDTVRFTKGVQPLRIAIYEESPQSFIVQ